MTNPPESADRELQPLWDIDQVATYLNLGRRTISRMVASGQIPFVKISGSLRFPPSVIEEWIRAQALLNWRKRPEAHAEAEPQSEGEPE